MLRLAGLCAASAMLYGIAGIAAVPVVESQGERGPAAASQPEIRADTDRPFQIDDEPDASDSDSGMAPAKAGEGDLAELFYELQLLREEVRGLRGTVEEQAYLLERLTRETQAQYMDLDRRLASGGGSIPGAEPGQTTSPGTARPPTPAYGSGQSGAPASEREAYTAAFDLMRNKAFDESIAAFDQMIVDYPNGRYTPNAYYWLGELHLVQANLELARESFAQVVNLYPDHQKVPDALYKLGVVYHRLGDAQRSLEYLKRVSTTYPGTPAAGLAEQYAREVQ